MNGEIFGLILLPFGCGWHGSTLNHTDWISLTLSGIHFSFCGLEDVYMFLVPVQLMHLQTKSLAWLHILSTVDYSGITLYAFGLSMALYFYERLLGVSIYEYKWIFVITYMTLTGFALLMCSLSRFRSGNPVVHTVDVRICEYKWMFAITYVTFVMLAVSMSSLSRFQNHIIASLSCNWISAYIHLTGAISLVTHLLVCLCTDDVFVLETFPQFGIHIIFFVTKIPEKLNPGRYDYYFQSHQLFHILVVVKTTLVYCYIPNDASIRRAHIEQNDCCLSSVEDVLIPFTFLLFMIIIIVTVVAILNPSKMK